MVADSGSPSLSATRNFNVIVNPLTLRGVTGSVSGGRINFSVNGQVGSGLRSAKLIEPGGLEHTFDHQPESDAVQLEHKSRYIAIPVLSHQSRAVLTHGKMLPKGGAIRSSLPDN